MPLGAMEQTTGSNSSSLLHFHQPADILQKRGQDKQAPAKPQWQELSIHRDLSVSVNPGVIFSASDRGCMCLATPATGSTRCCFLLVHHCLAEHNLCKVRASAIWIYKKPQLSLLTLPGRVEAEWIRIAAALSWGSCLLAVMIFLLLMPLTWSSVENIRYVHHYKGSGSLFQKRHFSKLDHWKET